jgi:hypothetical protein
MIEQLLLHRSGVADPSYSEIATSRVSLSDLVGRIASKPLLFEPGTNGGYSNAGYVLLAAVVERASGMSDADFVRRNIGERLGLHGTFPDLQDEIVPNRAMGYVPGPPPNAIRNVAWYDMSPLIGSGSLVSNVRDLYRWAQAVHREELSRRTTLRYPYGWGVRKYYDRDLIEQSGTIDGFTSYLGVYFRDSTYVVCLTDIEASLNEQCGKDLAAMAFGLHVAPSTPFPQPARLAVPGAADSGWYRSESIGSFRISETDGNTVVRWTTARTPHYAQPVATVRDSGR